MPQELEKGVALSNRYEGLDGYTDPLLIRPSNATCFIVGFPGAGKSHLLQTHPEGVIMNLDLSSTVTSAPQALMWPRLNAKGRPVDGNNIEYIFGFDHVRSFLGRLRTLSETGKHRPTTIIIDSITSLIKLMTMWYPAHAPELGLANEVKSEWKHLDGRAAWPALYDHVVRIFTDLRNQGYGVTVVGHLKNDKIPLGENIFKTNVDVNMPDKLWYRLVDMFELSAHIYPELVTTTEDRVVEESIRGVISTRKEKVPVTKKKHFISVVSPHLEGILKSRAPFDRIELPESGAWATFEEAYMKAANAKLLKGK